MADLHARLLDATTPLLAGERYSTARLNGPLAALRAVVELHRCAIDVPLCRECWNSGAEDYEPWPCSTIRVIAERLGVPIDKSITEKEERRG